MGDCGECDQAGAHTPLRLKQILDFLARTESVTVLDAGDAGPESATALVGNMKILIPLAGLIDKDAELARLDKEIQRLQGEVQRVGLAERVVDLDFFELEFALVVEALADPYEDAVVVPVADEHVGVLSNLAEVLEEEEAAEELVGTNDPMLIIERLSRSQEEAV